MTRVVFFVAADWEAWTGGAVVVTGAGAVPPEAELLVSPSHYAAIHPLLNAALDALVARPAAR